MAKPPNYAEYEEEDDSDEEDYVIEQKLPANVRKKVINGVMYHVCSHCGDEKNAVKYVYHGNGRNTLMK